MSTIAIIAIFAVFIGSMVILHLSATEMPGSTQPDDVKFGHYNEQKFESKTGARFNHPCFP